MGNSADHLREPQRRVQSREIGASSDSAGENGPSERSATQGTGNSPVTRERLFPLCCISIGVVGRVLEPALMSGGRAAALLKKTSAVFFPLLGPLPHIPSFRRPSADVCL